MFCPNCGMECGATKYCANCGTELNTQQQKLIHLKAPVGLYEDFACSVEVKEDSITFIHKRIGGNSVRTIPYSQIYQVIYSPGKKFKAGFLCVREWQDRHQPLLKDARECVLDETSLSFNEIENPRFEEIYHFIKKIAARNAAEGLVLPAGPEALYGVYKGLYGSMELYADGVVFVKNGVLKTFKNNVIHYDEIVEVGFREGRGMFQYGGLSVRSRIDKSDLRYKLRNVLKDPTSIAFYESANEKMCKVYEFLVDKVRENTCN